MTCMESFRVPGHHVIFGDVPFYLTTRGRELHRRVLANNVPLRPHRARLKIPQQSLQIVLPRAKIPKISAIGRPCTKPVYSSNLPSGPPMVPS